jgi:hypothetical protein
VPACIWDVFKAACRHIVSGMVCLCVTTSPVAHFQPVGDDEAELVVLCRQCVMSDCCATRDWGANTQLHRP